MISRGPIWFLQSLILFVFISKNMYPFSESKTRKKNTISPNFCLAPLLRTKNTGYSIWDLVLIFEKANFSHLHGPFLLRTASYVASTTCIKWKPLPLSPDQQHLSCASKPQIMPEGDESKLSGLSLPRPARLATVSLSLDQQHWELFFRMALNMKHFC